MKERMIAMNTNYFFRASMAANYTTKKFFEKVTSDIEAQLRQWDAKVEMAITSWRTYAAKFEFNGSYYRVVFSKNEIDVLRDMGAYALDEKIWHSLVKQGLEVQESEGNYMEKVHQSQLLHVQVS